MNRPQAQLWVFAGPNGTGKSTLVSRYKLLSRIPIVNPDDMAQAIRADHRGEASVQNQAGRLAIVYRKRLLQEGRSFGIETTLTGRGELPFMRAARECGYKINLGPVNVMYGVTKAAARSAIKARDAACAGRTRKECNAECVGRSGLRDFVHNVNRP